MKPRTEGGAGKYSAKCYAKAASSQLSFNNLPQISTLATHSLYETLLDMSGRKQLLEIKYAAEMLGIDYKVVYWAIRGGRLPAYRFNTLWLIQTADLAAYMAKDSNQHESKSLLETVVESLNPLDPEDCRFRQALDDYISDTAAMASKQHSLRAPYALAYAVALASTQLDAEATIAASSAGPRVTRKAKPKRGETA